MKKKLSSALALILISALLLASLCITIGAASALRDGVRADAMEEIMANLGTDSETTKNYMVGEKIVTDDGGYVGTVELSVFFDEEAYDVKPGYHGTPIILYTVNTLVERIGKDSDTEIIKSMLDRGYVVIVADYLNSDKAVSPALDNSTSMLRTRMRYSEYLTAPIFPAGDYYEIHLCPAGYNVLLDQIFWSADKHGVDGTLEKIVEIWNGDFKHATKNASKLVIWATGDTVDTRKKVATAADGTEPVWYDAEGNVDENGLYTKVKYTVAKTVFDCVNPDGSMVCLDLYIHVVYPTVNETSEPVPVITQANSSTYPTTTVDTLDDRRAISAGCLFNGYAQVVYDYFYTPMSRGDSWTYFSGETSPGAVTGDNLTYSVHVYNDKLIVTSAMRYLRHLTLSQPDTYKFDTNAFAVYGNSKGGYISFLGEEYLQGALVGKDYGSTLEYEQAIDKALASITPLRYLDGHHGETRYQVGLTENITDEATGYTIRAGELQPWITYGGEEILSGAQVTYVANGSESENVSAGHRPMIVTVHLNDSYNAAYGESNRFANMVRTMDIPAFIVEVPLGHTMTYGPDVDYGVDVYDAIFRFFGYYLKGDAVSVLFTTPQNNEGRVNVTDKITLQFSGAVSIEEISKVTVSDGGEALLGSWSSALGDTEWTFTPYEMKGGAKYTLTVPAELKGANGVAMDKAYTSEFYTEIDSANAADITYTDTASGRFIDLTAPESLTDIYNGYAIRFFVSNNAANIAELYAIDPHDYDTNGASAQKGALVGKVNLRGAGSYEIDVTDYIAERAGERVVFLLCAKKTPGTVQVYENDYSETQGSISKDAYVSVGINNERFADNPVFEVKVNTNDGKFGNGHTFYQGVNTAFSLKGIIPETLTADDLGRQFVFSVRIFDTVSRVIQLKYDTNTNRVDYGVKDYDHPIINVRTKANEWITVELPYTVYDADYGKVGASRSKYMTFRVGSTGDTEIPVYLDDVTVTEYITDMDITSVTLAKTCDGSIPYKEPESDKPLALYNGAELIGEYAAWNSALNAYKAGYTLKLRSDYTLTDADLFSGFGTLSAAKSSDGEHIFGIDLNGYTLKSANSKNSLLWLKNTSANIPETTINVYNGAILLGKTPLVSYEDSTRQGAGKSFEINLTDTYIGLIEGANITEAISAYSIAAGALTDVEISLVGCTLDFPDDLHAKDVIELLPKATGDLGVHYTLDGGSIILSAQKFVTVQNDATVSKLIDDATGSYTKLILPASKTPDNTSYLREDGYAIYTPESSADGFVTCTLYKSENSTLYGIIDEAYTDSGKYPFLVFSGGIFRGGYPTLKEASTAATNLVKGENNSSASAQVLLRRDYENSDSGDQFMALNSIAGELVLDLGGHTLTRNQTFLYFKADTTSAPFATSFTVTNGEIRTRGGSIVSFQSADNQTVAKIYDITFDGITFGLADAPTDATKTAMNFIIEAYNTATASVSSNTAVTFNDCDIDLVTNSDKYSALNTVTLFKTYDKYDRTNISVNVNGGRISANDFSKVVFANANTSGNDTLTVGKGSDGKFITATLAGEGQAPSVGLTDTDGASREFSLVSGSENKYELTINKLVTEYGTIPSEYKDAELYPFVVFYNNTFVGAYSAWAESSDTQGLSALGDAKRKISGASGAGKTATILLRRDYFATDTDLYYNLSQVGGTLEIDLGEHTFYVGKNDMFYAEGKLTGGTAHLTEILVKNGTVLNNGSGSVAAMRSSNKLTSDYSKKFSFTFEGVTFGVTQSSTSERPIINSPSSNGALCEFVYSFDNCVFDYAAVAPTVSVTLFYLERNASDTNKASVSINGGEFLFDSYSGITLFRAVSKASLVMAKDKNGNYPTLTAPSALAPNKTVFDTAAGKAVFMEESDDGVTSVYRITPVTYVEASDIAGLKDSFFSLLDNPFVVVFDGGYTPVADWKTALDTAKGKVHGTAGAGKTVEILLRRDYTSLDAVYYNLSQLGGKLVVDLLGNTFYIGANDMFYADGKLTDGTAHLTEILVKNGTVLNNGAGSVVEMRSQSALTSAHSKKFSFTFEDITFGITASNTATTLVAYSDSNNSKGYACEFAFSFNDCTFDYTTTVPTSNVALFGNKSESDTNSVAITVNGGHILASTASSPTFFVKQGANDGLTFAKLQGGEYTRLTLPMNVSAPTAEYNHLKFLKESDDGKTTTYILTFTKADSIDFTPKASVTLDSNLIFNIYLPEHEGLGAVTLNGTAVTLGEAKEGYYLVTVELPANEAAKLLTLTVEINEDGTDVIGSFTFSTVKYAQKLLTMDIIDEEKILAKDILAYIKSAYEYFTVADRTAVIDEIDAILGNYVSGKVINVADAKCDTDGLSGATFVLGATPAIRFYLDGYTADKFSFKVGERALKVTDANLGSDAGGSYIEFTLFAYEMTETLTYEIKGTEISGEYNIISYYADAVAKSDTALVDIVAKFYNYCLSAKDYKSSLN